MGRKQALFLPHFGCKKSQRMSSCTSKAQRLHLKSIAVAPQTHSGCTSNAQRLHFKSIAPAPQKHSFFYIFCLLRDDFKCQMRLFCPVIYIQMSLSLHFLSCVLHYLRIKRRLIYINSCIISMKRGCEPLKSSLHTLRIDSQMVTLQCEG